MAGCGAFGGEGASGLRGAAADARKRQERRGGRSEVQHRDRIGAGLFTLLIGVSLALHLAVLAFLLNLRPEKSGAVERPTTAISVNLETTDVLDAVEESAATAAAGPTSVAPEPTPEDRTKATDEEVKEAESRKLAEEDVQRKAEEEERQRLAEEAEKERIAEEQRQAQEAEKQRVAEERQRQAEDAERRRAAEEAQRKAEEVERQRVAEETERQRLAEEALRKAEDAERQRVAEEERRKAAEAERQRLAEETRRKAEAAEHEARERAREEEAKRRADEQERQRKIAEEREKQRELAEKEAEDKRRQAAKKRAEEEESRKRTAQSRAGASGERDAQASRGRVSASQGSISEYGDRVRAQINRNKPTDSTGNGSVYITFRLSTSGSILFARITGSSADATQQQKAMAALRRSGPFPPPPAGASPGQLVFSVPYHFRQKVR